jgi:hypothetical protein
MNEFPITDNDTEPTITHLEPGCDTNPLEYNPTYNPLHYTYQMDAHTESGPCHIWVHFALQEYKNLDTITFNHNNKTHQIPLFPKLPKIGLEPIQNGIHIDKEHSYQIGENPYYLLPTIIKAEITNPNGEPTTLTHQATTYLITPDILLETINKFQEKCTNDPNTPTDLLEMLNHWNPKTAWKSNDHDENYEEDDEDDENDEDEDDEDDEDDENYDEVP